MEVFEFDENTFLGSLDFFDTEQGIAELEHYIRTAVPAQAYLLVDLQDEDFRPEYLPHVRGKDRKAIIARMERKIFRDLEYCQTVSLGRSKEGRKDELFMFSSLLNAEALDRWMGIFTSLDIPICGIWSVSYLSEQIINKVGAVDGHILLFSRQMRSAVRETIFKDGKLLISRQAKLERHVRDDENPETYAAVLANNVDTMHRFLINQRLLSFADSLTVYAVLKPEQIKEVSAHCKDTKTLNFKYLSISDLFKQFKITNCERPAMDVLLAYLCSNRKPEQQQYLPKKHREPFKRYQVNQFIRGVSSALTLCFVVVATFLLLNAHEFDIEAEALVLRKKALQNEYNTLYRTRQAEIDGAETVKAAVDLLAQVERYNAITPQSMFSELARTYQNDAFLRFSLDGFSWTRNSPRQLQAIASEFRDPAKIVSAEEFYDESDAEDAQSFQPILQLYGRLNKNGLSYDHAVALMEGFTNSIVTVDGLETLHIINTPIDVRAGKQFSDSRGMEQAIASESDTNNRYELRLIFAPVDNDGVVDETL